MAVFGGIAEDGRKLFRTFTGSFTSVQFIQCLEALRAKFGKVAVFCDRWSVHRSAAVAEYLAGHPDVRLIMLPKGSPYLNVVEECWNLGRPVVFRGIAYGKVGKLRHAISEYYRMLGWFLLPPPPSAVMPGKKNPGPLTTGDLVIRGTVMASIITVPSLAAFLASWAILDDLIQAAIVGAVVHFIAMGFSLKISKRFLTKRPGANPDV